MGSLNKPQPESPVTAGPAGASQVSSRPRGQGAREDSAFRRDVNGLRAWAVVAVVLYHFGVPGFSGGFVGVDVFFVISGYLMTGILVSAQQRGSLSLTGFWLARARRIMPALIAVGLALLLLGFWRVIGSDYQTMATHLLGSLLFVSNAKYWSEAGYFDAASHDKWLLHTWSLSVEWQFYLVLPLVVIAVSWLVSLVSHRNASASQPLPASAQSLPVGLTVAVAALTLASWLFGAWQQTVDASAAFYLLPARAWEMLAGGLVYLLQTQLWVRRWILHQRWAQAAGFAAILASILLFDTQTAWPGWRASLPVLGTMLVLWAAMPQSLWTGTQPAQWLGDRSYSLYLWHWPIVVALSYGEWLQLPAGIAAGMVATLVLGAASMRWVEQPSRRWLAARSQLSQTLLLGLMLTLLIVACLAIRSAQGWPQRFADKVQAVAAAQFDINPRREACHPRKGLGSPSCVWGERPAAQQATVVVLGDSHASMLVGTVAQALSPAGGSSIDTKVIQWTYSGCPFVMGLRQTSQTKAQLGADYQCEGFIQWAQARLAELPPQVPVVLINRYAQQALGANEALGHGAGDADHAGKAPPAVYFSSPAASANPAFMAEFSQAITRTACSLAQGGRPVVVVRPVPEMGFDVPKTLSRRLAFGVEQDVSVPLTSYQARNGWVWQAQDLAQQQCGVKLVDPTTMLCNAQQCLGSEALTPLYSDDDHLTETAARRLAPLFRDALHADKAW